MRVDGAAVGEPDGALGPVDLQRGGRAGGDQFGAELLRLSARPIGQLAARHPVRKAEIVLDPRALAGLTAGRGAFDEHRAQPLGSAVDGGGQARGSTTDHDQVVELLRRRGGQAQRVGQFGVAGFDQGVAAFGDDDR